MDMAEHPERVRRRLIPDAAQLQIILGSLLGGARIAGEPGERWMRIAAATERAGYVRWKYERLAVFADAPPVETPRDISFRTIAHPLFDDLAPLVTSPRGRVLELLSPLGVAVWMADAGRLELRPDAFMPRRVASQLRAA
ncbi:MAG TPA: hypothetical protein VM052_01675 [Candidatus Limnocylindrales bacterium]|nr:hypothetical protein [Candidatus Limnocylindrales bacterium]